MFKGELDQAAIKGIDLNDLYILEQGTRHAGAKKILIKHYGEESTGGLTNEELINMSEVIKNGSVLLESFEKRNNGFRYAYEWGNNGVKLRLVVDDLDSGNKIFDFYSDRNITGAGPTQKAPAEANAILKEAQSQEDLLKTQENLNETTQTPLSPLEQAKAEKLAKLESEKLESEKEFTRLKEQETKRKEALKKKLEHERGNAGNIESATKIEGNNKDLENHWVISSYELRDTTEKPTHFPTSQAITKEKDIHSLNSVEPNLTTNPLKTQEPKSTLELARSEKKEIVVTLFASLLELCWFFSLKPSWF